MSRKGLQKCPLVNATKALQHEESKGDHGHGDVAVPTDPRATLQVVKAKFILQLL